MKFSENNIALLLLERINKILIIKNKIVNNVKILSTIVQPMKSILQ